MQPYNFDGVTNPNNQVVYGPIYWAVVLSARATNTPTPQWSFNDGVLFTLGQTGLWARVAPNNKPWKEIKLLGNVVVICSHDPCEPFPQGFAQPNEISGNFKRAEWTQLIRSGQAFTALVTQPTPAGVFAVVALNNPSTSNLRFLVRNVGMGSSSNQFNYLRFGPLVAGGVNGTNLLNGGAVSTGTVTNSTVAAQPAGQPITTGTGSTGGPGAITPGVVNLMLNNQDFICELGPGSALYTINSSINTDVTAVYWWAEIPLLTTLGSYP